MRFGYTILNIPLKFTYRSRYLKEWKSLVVIATIMKWEMNFLVNILVRS